MDSENRNKRDLPEVVADILITLDKVQQTQAQMQQTMQQMQVTQKEQHAEIISSFNHMTNAVLDAMNRQTARYDTVQTTQTTQETDVRELRQRLENLEKVVYKQAG